MYDTYVTIVGNVMTTPEWRRTKNTGSLVAHFKVASTARRLDRETGQWVDGNSLRVRVNCWRKLAEGVGGSLITGDPVIVVGRLYTRDWLDENDNRRIGYELEAVAVGHDLSRGQSSFVRNKPALATSAVEDERDEHRVGGEQTEPVLPEQVPPERVPPRRNDREFDDRPPAMPVPVAVAGEGDGLGVDGLGVDGLGVDGLGVDGLGVDGLEVTDGLGVELGADRPGDGTDDGPGDGSGEEAPGTPGLAEEPRGRGRRRGRAAVPV
jgi:single-strand DNA-binding protein